MHFDPSEDRLLYLQNYQTSKFLDLLLLNWAFFVSFPISICPIGLALVQQQINKLKEYQRN